MHVCMHIQVHTHALSIQAHVEVRLQHWKPYAKASPPCSLRQGISLNHKLALLTSLTGQPVLETLVFALHCWHYKGALPCLAFYVGVVRDPNPGLHACAERILPTKPSPQLQ